MFYWHVTDVGNLDSILKTGLRAPVYLGASPGVCLWIRTQQEEEKHKIGGYAILRIWLNDKYILEEDPETDHDAFICNQYIPFTKIKVECFG